MRRADSGGEFGGRGHREVGEQGDSTGWLHGGRPAVAAQAGRPGVSPISASAVDRDTDSLIFALQFTLPSPAPCPTYLRSP